MGYPRDLQDYEDQELIRELERRVANRHRGLCDYCGQGPGHPTCRYPKRHNWQEVPDAGVWTALTFNDLRAANSSRQKRWPGSDLFTGADFSNEMAGEVGEACNLVKKLRRDELGVLGNKESKGELLVSLSGELADVVITADLVAGYYGIELGQATRHKFNLTSANHGFPECLPVPAPARAREETFGACPVCQQPADGHGH